MADLLRASTVVDDVLATHVAAIGPDLAGYRHHVYRVLNFALALAPRGADSVEKLAVAAVFHDLGIWTAGTFDYLPPSIALAASHLGATARAAWVPELTAMIEAHHKVTPWRGRSDWLVEPFRRADWIDVTLGGRRFGLDRAFVTAVRRTWADEGFHWRLLQLTAARWRRHPLSPLPMLRW